MTAHTGITRQIGTVAFRLETASAVLERGSDGLIALLLEDEPLIAMETTLLMAGLDVSCARSGKEAHAWLNQRLPDVVIVDIQLSDGKCTDVVSRLVEANIPFIVHSGDNPSMHANTPFLHGVWISKPRAPEELVVATSNALASNRCAVPDSASAM